MLCAADVKQEVEGNPRGQAHGRDAYSADTAEPRHDRLSLLCKLTHIHSHTHAYTHTVIFSSISRADCPVCMAGTFHPSSSVTPPCKWPQCAREVAWGLLCAGLGHRFMLQGWGESVEQFMARKK